MITAPMLRCPIQEWSSTMPYLEINGYCPICEAPRLMTASDSWYRDKLVCPGCRAIPRNRALMLAMNKFAPNWRKMSVHESSPVWTGVSNKLFRECPGYSWSYYEPLVPEGANHPDHGWRNENIEAMTFADASFDLFVTQDVFEHLYRPDVAAAEIARVLRPGGMHIFTVPLPREHLPSIRRARKIGDKIQHLEDPVYHGDPINSNGALVIIDWGYDIVEYLSCSSGMLPTIVCGQDREMGILGVLLEVIVMKKKRFGNAI